MDEMCKQRLNASIEILNDKFEELGIKVKCYISGMDYNEHGTFDFRVEISSINDSNSVPEDFYVEVVVFDENGVELETEFNKIWSKLFDGFYSFDLSFIKDGIAYKAEKILVSVVK